jgi:uncharacterized protein YodC (DUF2158 family)
MSEEIKAGDVVVLKSGSLKMTVRWVSDEYGTLTAGCDWIDAEGKKQFERFPVTSLKHAE